MALNFLKYLVFSALLISPQFLPVNGQGYTLSSEGRDLINSKTYVPQQNASSGAIEWTTPSDTANQSKYYDFPPYRGFLEGFGFFCSIFPVFGTPELTGDKLEHHLQLSTEEKINKEKPVWIGVINDGGCSYNLVVAFLAHFLKGGQVVFVKCASYTEAEQDEKSSQYAAAKEKYEEYKLTEGYDDANIIVTKYKELESSKNIKASIAALLKLMQDRGVIIRDLGQKSVEEIVAEMSTKFGKIGCVVDGIMGQGKSRGNIYDKVKVALHFVAEITKAAAAHLWQTDVISCYQDRIEGRAAHHGVPEIQAPFGTSPILGFSGHEASVSGFYHVVVPAPVEKTIQSSKDAGQNIFGPAPPIAYKKIVVNITDMKAWQILQDPDLFNCIGLLRELFGYFNVIVTDYTV